jgi:hypothetical protein
LLVKDLSTYRLSTQKWEKFIDELQKTTKIKIMHINKCVKTNELAQTLTSKIFGLSHVLLQI